ncbi:MAG: hypothetical protein ACRD3G_25025 [Vicinamibacterales bacterium]
MRIQETMRVPVRAFLPTAADYFARRDTECAGACSGFSEIAHGGLRRRYDAARHLFRRDA